MTLLLAGLPAVAVAVLLSAGCVGQDRRLEQHGEKLRSLQASAVLVAEAWLAEDASGAYTTMALQRLYELVEQERHALASVPDDLGDPRGARLVDVAGRLERDLAAMMRDVRVADRTALREARERLVDVPVESR